jgi:hypothetical protein
LKVSPACASHGTNDGGGASCCIAGFVVSSTFSGWFLFPIIVIVALSLLSKIHLSDRPSCRFLQHDSGITLCHSDVAVAEFKCERLLDSAEGGAKLLKCVRSSRLHNRK